MGRSSIYKDYNTALLVIITYYFPLPTCSASCHSSNLDEFNPESAYVCGFGHQSNSWSNYFFPFLVRAREFGLAKRVSVHLILHTIHNIIHNIKYMRHNINIILCCRLNLVLAD